MKDIIEQIKNANTVAITAHIDEDADALGSCLALAEIMRAEGKTVTHFLERTVDRRLKFLEKDCIVFDKAEDYGEFDLLICLDTGDEKRLGERISLFDKARVIVNIDHHYTNTNYADYNWVNGDMSSTGEIIYDLLLMMGAKISKSVAEYLYCSIMGDTGGLKYSSATPKTVITVAKLMETGIDHAELARRLFDTETAAALRLKGHIMNEIESYFDARVHVVSLDDADFEKYGAKEDEVGDIVNIPRIVEGTQIAVSLRKKGNDVKISLRSNGVYNVGEIAVALGGGGHKMAAGVAIDNCEIPSAKEKVLQVIGEVING